MIRRLPWLLPLCAASLSAQQHDPVAVPTTIRTVLRADGTPMPGVPVHVVAADLGRPPALRDGWLVATDERLHRLAHSRVVRSDPEGRITLSFPDGEPNVGLFAGAPFRSQRLERDADGFLLRVDRLEHFRVRAVDHAGSPLARFPLAIEAAGQIEQVACTDDTGHAMFGVDPTVTVRLVVVPFGWIGSRDGFPTVASQAPTATTTLPVPAFGTVRVRTLRGGAPAACAVHSAALSRPLRCDLGRNEFTQVDCFGAEFGPVPLGTELQGLLRVGGVTPAFTVRGPTVTGEIVYADVETDPARPKLAFEVAGVPASPFPWYVSVRVVTDAGTFGDSVQAGKDCRAVVGFAARSLRGERLLRVDLDVVATVGPAGVRAFSASLPQDRALVDAVLDLGVVTLAEHAPLLRGRVVDGGGRPIGGARVTVQAEPEPYSWMQQTTSSAPDGGFVVHGPLPRGAGGEVLPTRAWATVGRGVDRIETDATPAQPLGAAVTLVVARPARGSIALSLRDPQALPRWQLVFTFVDAKGQRHELDSPRQRWSGPRAEVCTVGEVPAGRGELHVGLRPGVALVRLGEVDVEADRTVAPPELCDLDLSAAVAVRRVRAVDEHGVAIARVTVRYARDGSTDECSMTTSDRGGFADVTVGPRALRATLEADGMEPRLLTDVVDGADVVLAPRRQVGVTVRGLPADVPPDRLYVLLRPVPRELLADTVQVPLAADGTASLPRPKPGAYWLRVAFCTPPSGTDVATTWETVYQAPAPVLVAEGAGDSFACEVDAAAVARIAALLAK